MYLIVSLAAAAAALVLIYNHRKEGGVDLAESWVGRAQQLAAVVLVLTRAVEGLLEALGAGRRTKDRAGLRPAPGRRLRRGRLAMSVHRIAPDDDDPEVAGWDKQRFGIQVVMAGLQDVHVIARSASAAGMAHGCIAVRIGRVLVYVEDREALWSLTSAVKKAVELVDTAFGRRYGPTYRPRNPMQG